MSDSPRVVSEMLMAEGKFVSFKLLKWTDADGVQRVWEAAERQNNRNAVLVVPRLVPSGRLVLIKQFRPPARGMVVEFPAGLLDGGETPEEGARRELKEETGYVAARFSGGIPAFTTPGLSDETVCIFHVEIDENLPENRDPETRFDSGEMIETILVAPDELAGFCEREYAKGVHLDAKVLAFAGVLSMRSAIDGAARQAGNA